jgi:hypothetical protein
MRPGAIGRQHDTSHRDITWHYTHIFSGFHYVSISMQWHLLHCLLIDGRKIRFSTYWTAINLQPDCTTQVSPRRGTGNPSDVVLESPPNAVAPLIHPVPGFRPANEKEMQTMIRSIGRIVVKEYFFEVYEAYHHYLDTSFFPYLSFERFFHAFPDVDTAARKLVFACLAHLEEK